MAHVIPYWHVVGNEEVLSDFTVGGRRIDDGDELVMAVRDSGDGVTRKRGKVRVVRPARPGADPTAVLDFGGASTVTIWPTRAGELYWPIPSGVEKV